MRNLILSLLVVCCFVSCKQSVKGKNGVTYKNPVEYNDYIVTRQSRLIQNMLQFGKVADVNLDSAEALLKRSVSESEEMIDEIKGMPVYKGDSMLRNTAVRSFSFYKKVFENEYMDILNFRRKGDNITSEDMTELNDIIQNISKEEEGYDRAFRRAQEKFAESNKMKLTDNKMQKEIDKIND